MPLVGTRFRNGRSLSSAVIRQAEGFMTDSRSAFDYEAAIAACSARESQAMRALYDREAGRMLGVALRIVRDPGIAEDVVHETFVNIWRYAATFDEARGSARTWIYSILRNEAIGAARRQSRHPTPAPHGSSGNGSDEDEIERIPDPAATRRLETSPEMGRLHTCLEALESERRDCVLLSYVEGYSHGEIAERLGVPLGTVKSWIKRALLALRDCMS